MIVLDTNVLSEPLKPMPAKEVLAWFDRQPASSLFLNTITMAELLQGVGLLPAGKRRSALQDAYHREIFPSFGDRVLPFDRDAAEMVPHLTERARAAGRSIGVADTWIGAIAASRRYAVATRDSAAFEAMGLPVLNPWLDGLVE